jgi:hypothetical protein
VTFFGLIFTPVFYVLCRWLAGFMPKAPEKERTLPTTYGTPPHDRVDPPATGAAPAAGDAA